MTTRKWLHGVDGDFNNAPNWSGASVPGSSDLADINAGGTYTVSSFQLNTVATLDMARGATLDIAEHHFVVTGTGTSALAGTIDVTNLTALILGTPPTTHTTFNNAGTINLQSGNNAGDNAVLSIAGNVTLIGAGKVNLSGGDAKIVVSQNTPATLNSDTTIVGDGVIGDLKDGLFTFVNDARGVVDGNTSGGLLVATEGTTVTNSGLMEATTGSGVLLLTGNIKQTGNGTIKAANSGATVFLQGADITGGQYATVSGGILWATDGTSPDNQITNAKPINNAGTVAAIGGNLVITGAVDNTSTGIVQAGGVDGNGMLTIEGALKGGHAALVGASDLILEGATSAQIVFSAGATGNVDFFDAGQFTGSVADMSQAPGASLDLENIEFGDDPSVNFNATTHLLTVTDPIEHVTDKIKIVGTGTFTKSAAFDGSTLIADPPTGAGAAQSAQLLAQSIAAFSAANSGGSGDRLGVTDDLASSQFLTGNSQLTHG